MIRKLYDKCVPNSVRYAVWIFWPIVLGGWVSHAAFQNISSEPRSLVLTMMVVGPMLIIGRIVEACIWGMRRYLSTGPRARAAQAEYEAKLKAEQAASDPPASDPPGDSGPGP